MKNVWFRGICYLKIHLHIPIGFLSAVLFCKIISLAYPILILNHIPYDYMVEVTNRFRGLDLMDRVPEELWTEVHDIVQEARIKTTSKKKKCKKVKWSSEEALQIAL